MQPPRAPMQSTLQPQHPKKDTNPLQGPLFFPAFPSQAADRCKDRTVVCIAIVVRFYWFFVGFFFCFFNSYNCYNTKYTDWRCQAGCGHHAPGQGVTPCDLQREGGGGRCSTWQRTMGTPESWEEGEQGRRDGGVRPSHP